MEAFRKCKPGNKKYLIIPAMPTPNGRLHLGHMSGPYLKMDILLRAQRRNGNDACLISGCDAYESYVPLKAWLTDKTAEEVCNHFSDLAIKDLQALNIYYDAYVNPIDPEFKQWFIEFAEEKMQDLIEQGLTAIRSEKVQYSPAGNRYIVGCWLTGKCPVCHSGSGSYQCEDCGTQYRPMDIIDPQSRAGDTDLVEIEDKTLYLKVAKKEALWQHIEQMQIGDAFKNILKVYFEHQGDYIRLTNPDTGWGIPWEVPGSPTEQVIYTATYMNAYVVFMGELYQRMYQTDLNPFDPASEVITVCSFGIDCSIPYILGLSWGIESGSFKPLDYLLPNFFCNLGDSKFSTSRGHAIWGDDIVSKTPLSSDAVRYYLTKINPEHETTSFQIDHFINTVSNELAGELQGTLSALWRYVKPTNSGAGNRPLFEQLDELLATQLEHLSPPGFEMKKSLEPLQSWLNLERDVAAGAINAYWWFKGFALLAYPIMPDCATSIWQLLGHTGLPAESHFFELTTPDTRADLPIYFAAISYEDIVHVLPESVVNA